MPLANPKKMHLQGDKLHCRGSWCVADVAALAEEAKTLPSLARIAQIRCEAIQQMDTAGCTFLQDLCASLRQQNPALAPLGFSASQQKLWQLLELAEKQMPADLSKVNKPSWLYRFGETSVAKLKYVYDCLDFLGEVAVVCVQTFSQWRQFHWREWLLVIERAGSQALPIIGLLTFLIGFVLAYQLGLQLKTYGANIYIVYLLGLAILREFAPLIAAIIVAGRSGAAYTAEIGSKLLNEEVDAIRTFGLSPIKQLALPKIVGLVLTMPLLFVWADIFGVLGGMVMAKSMLGIGYYPFLMKFSQVIHVNDFLVGLVKAPVFAMIIAVTGCMQGFRVSANAESLGLNTTRSVVQSIFLIIIADAFFSILFQWAGI